MTLRPSKATNSTIYTKLKSDDEAESTTKKKPSYPHLGPDDNRYDENRDDDIRYRDRIGNPPLKSIGFAFILLCLGCLFVGMGISFVTGYVETEFWKRGFMFMGVGILLIIPGCYVLFIAIATCLGITGYKYSMIPD